MNRYLKYLSENSEIIALLVSIVVGIATIITSAVNVYLVKCQIDINKEQNALQKKQCQPIFDIVIKQQQDSDDGKYGTDILEVRNIGGKIPFCKIESSVFFCLSYHHKGIRDSICVKIADYFYASISNTVGDGLITQEWCPGNNRKFCEGYFQAINDSHDETVYFYDKIVLLKIDYKDIMNESHTIYYKKNIQISEEQYKYYFDAADQSWNIGFLSLRDDIYNKMMNQLKNKK